MRNRSATQLENYWSLWNSKDLVFFLLIRDVFVNYSVAGGELYDRIVRRNERPYSERDAARYISMLVEAVAHLHALDIVRHSKLYSNIVISFFFNSRYI